MLSDGILNELLTGIADPSFGRRFDVDEEAGRGGMGVVYHGTEAASGREVAIKLMSGGDRRDHGRFSREAEVLESLEHDNIVRYFEHGVTDAGDAYLVMEWLEGVTLSRRPDGEPLSWLELTDIGRQVTAALVAAHELGVIHRDIKPSNIFLEHGETERVVLLDFGVARRSDVDDTTLTSTGEIVGSPGYMAPEQVEGRGVDERTDLFALGVVLYELTCGRRAFVGDALIPVLMATLAEHPPPVASLRPEAPRRLAGLIEALLCKSPDGRPGSAAEVADELDALRDALVSGDTDALATTHFTGQRSSLEGEATAATVVARPVRTGRPTRRWLAILAAVACAVAGLAVGLSRRDATRRLGAVLASEGPRCDRDSHVGCELRCAAGNNDACTTLGESFAVGLRRQRDLPRARALLAGACKAGAGRACYRLSSLDGESEPDVKLLERACELNSPPGCRRLGTRAQEIGELAVSLNAFERGCDLGDVIACRRAAEIHQQGKGVEVSAEKARVFLRRACNRGYQWACEQLEGRSDGR